MFRSSCDVTWLYIVVDIVGIKNRLIQRGPSPSTICAFRSQTNCSRLEKTKGISLTEPLCLLMIQFQSTTVAYACAALRPVLSLQSRRPTSTCFSLPKALRQSQAVFTCGLRIFTPSLPCVVTLSPVVVATLCKTTTVKSQQVPCIKLSICNIGT